MAASPMPDAPLLPLVTCGALRLKVNQWSDLNLFTPLHVCSQGHLAAARVRLEAWQPPSMPDAPLLPLCLTRAASLG